MRGFYHQPHGDRLHNLAIFITKTQIDNAGHKLLDGEWFSKKHSYFDKRIGIVHKKSIDICGGLEDE